VDVRAIILIAPPAEGPREEFAGVPAALLDVLGKPAVQHVAERLRRQGVDEIAIIAEGSATAAASDALAAARAQAPAGVKWQPAAGGDAWRAAEQTFSEFAQNGAEVVLALRLGPYAELDFDHLVQFHLDSGARVTAAERDGVEFGVFAISASRRNDAAFLFRHRFTECRVPCTRYRFDGYLNRLAGARDLRELARDGLLQRNDLRPVGRELKPGVWAAEGARIDRGARVLAPAFIGARAVVRTNAVVTRCSTIERYAEVDCGTVVEDSSVLPYSYVGAGLDLAHAVAGFRRVASRRRGVEVEFSDPRLLGMISFHAPVRALASAFALAAYLPQQIVRGFFGRSSRPQPADLPAAVQSPAAALQAPDLKPSVERPTEFPSNLAVARRYGNE